MTPRWIIAGFMSLLVVPAFAQSAEEARRDLAATRKAGARADAESRRLDAAAAVSGARVVRARHVVAELDRALAHSDGALATARRQLTQAEAASKASDAALATARAPLARLVAALVRRQRQPPAMALAATPDLTESVRLRAALAAMAPSIEAQTASLRHAVIDAADRRRSAARAVADVSARQDQRDRQRAALRQAVAEEERQRDLALAEAVGAHQQADGLAEQAAMLEALAERLGRQDGQRARLTALPGPELRPGTPATTPQGSRAYRLPVNGRLLAGMGETTSTGIRTRGLLLAAAPGSIARAPAAGRIAYAGAFAAWRAIVIVDHGHGWTTLVAGLTTAAHPVGAMVAQGDPIGRTGARLLVELRHHGRPVDVAAMAQTAT